MITEAMQRAYPRAVTRLHAAAARMVNLARSRDAAEAGRQMAELAAAVEAMDALIVKAGGVALLAQPGKQEGARS